MGFTNANYLLIPQKNLKGELISDPGITHLKSHMKFCNSLQCHLAFSRRPTNVVSNILVQSASSEMWKIPMMFCVCFLFYLIFAVAQSQKTICATSALARRLTPSSPNRNNMHIMACQPLKMNSPSVWIPLHGPRTAEKEKTQMTDGLLKEWLTFWMQNIGMCQGKYWNWKALWTLPLFQLIRQHGKLSDLQNFQLQLKWAASENKAIVKMPSCLIKIRDFSLCFMAHCSEYRWLGWGFQSPWEK